MEKSPATSSDASQSSNANMWDWRAIILTIALVEISSSRLVITEWVPYLYFTQTISLAGVLLGFALGYSTFSRKAATRIAIGYSLILLPAQLLNAVERTDWVWTDLVTLFNRLFTSLAQFIKGQPVYDQLFFISLVTAGYWIIGISAGYWLTRHRDFLNVILPSCLAMLVVQVFDPTESRRMWALAFYLFAALLLLGRLYFLENQIYWKKTRFLLTAETINNLERGALTVAAVTIFVAWSIPGWIKQIKPAARAWQDFSEPILERLSDAVSALESPYAGRNAGGDFYSGELSLGQQAAVGDTPVFFVTVKESEFVPIRNYWKGRMYDLYINGRWTTLSDASDPFLPDTDELTVEYPENRNEMEFTFTNNATSQSLLYAPAEAVWVSREGTITSTEVSPTLRDVTAWNASPNLPSGGRYTVRTLIADPTQEELRLAGTEYPEWVTERYLQVPENVAPALRILAEEITAQYDNPFDKTQAITAYLRNEIEYTTEITDTPPENRDPVLWVLFDYKKGFCMYYASAETLMLRSIGIPARMAVGFAEGTFNEIEERYIVTFEDAHAWPEVYFPGIGWVEFEPTGNQLPIERAPTRLDINADATPDPVIEGTPAANPLVPPLLEEPPDLSNQSNSGASKAEQMELYRTILFYTLLVLTVGLGFFMTRRYALEERIPVYLASRYTKSGNTPPRWLNRWIRWTTLASIERTFQVINISLYWLGRPQPRHITSQERAQALIERLPSAETQIQTLLQEYQSTIYTPRAGNLTTARKAASLILLKTWQIRVKEALQSLDYRYNQLR
ncbi:transglutaminase domain-containing protein [Candidatus Villigracilis affinis]|uniref:transglutaminase-like domain-containing protein n=1 Tax=Candidatus Villigracilis affinis TaxID=3140682 RepID=UPI002A225718|nr:transglutaminase domain-containing protein [Anaerolineales bacterium]